MSKYTQKDYWVDGLVLKGKGNVVRWISNDGVPPTDILNEFQIKGWITVEDVVDSLAYKKEQDMKFLAEYVANRKKYGYSDEEKFEMQAAFGGEEVVDIFTGESVVY